MSTNLYWRPVVAPGKPPALDKALKWAIENYYGASARLTERDILFLEGVKACNSTDEQTWKDAQQLILLIQDSEGRGVDVWIE